MEGSTAAGATASKEQKWERRMARAKRLHRPRLKHWDRDGFATRRAIEFARFAAESPSSEQVPRFSCKDMPPERFWAEFEAPGKPCVISGIPTLQNWRAAEEWNFQALEDKYGDGCFKCGEDDDGYPVKVKLKHFFAYLRHQHDDSPLYIFDSRFESRASDGATKDMLKCFAVPPHFPEDLFELVGERRRPPYRWFLVGPKRSGTTVHIDPLGTAAWNTALVGRKRWVIFPPETSRRFAKGKTVVKPTEDDEPINYFLDHLPRMRAAADAAAAAAFAAATKDSGLRGNCDSRSGGGGGSSGGSSGIGGKVHGPAEAAVAVEAVAAAAEEDWRRWLAPIEFVQHPGDTVYIPAGYWHAVVNLDDTIAVTQNFVSRRNFDIAWVKTRSGRKKMAVTWLRRLGRRNPELAARVRELNAADNFVMPERREKKHKKAQKARLSEEGVESVARNGTHASAAVVSANGAMSGVTKSENGHEPNAKGSGDRKKREKERRKAKENGAAAAAKADAADANADNARSKGYEDCSRASKRRRLQEGA